MELEANPKSQKGNNEMRISQNALYHIHAIARDSSNQFVHVIYTFLNLVLLMWTRDTHVDKGRFFNVLHIGSGKKLYLRSVDTRENNPSLMNTSL